MRRRLASLQSRIAVLHIAAVAVVAILVPVANYVVLNQYADQFEARTLRGHAQIIASYLSHEPEGWHLSLPEDLRTLYAHGYDGLSYAILDEHQSVLFASSPDARFARASARITRSTSAKGDALYALSVLHQAAGHAAWIKVTQNVAHPDVIFDDIVSSFLSHIGWLTVAILSFLLAVDILVIRQALRPVLQSSRIASEIDPARSDWRLPEAGVPSELLPLIKAMNQALERLERGIQVQREFTADAAHELRTPLAVLRARMEMFPDQKAVSDIKTDVAAMSHVVDQLMELAEVEGIAIGPDSLADINAVTQEVVGMLAEFAIRRGKAIVLVTEDNPVWVKGDAALIFRAVRNLVDNAIKFTAAGSDVEIRVVSDGSIFVRDHGPGIPPSDSKVMFQRFWRGSRSPVSGSGLGLAIVSHIVQLHNAAIHVENNPDGGALFVLRFNSPTAFPSSHA